MASKTLVSSDVDMEITPDGQALVKGLKDKNRIQKRWPQCASEVIVPQLAEAVQPRHFGFRKS